MDILKTMSFSLMGRGHHEFVVETTLNGASATKVPRNHRYNSFKNLSDLLCMKHPLEAIPPIPPKDSLIMLANVMIRENDQRLLDR